MSAGKGKRGADGPLVVTSSSSGSSDEDSPRHPPPPPPPPHPVIKLDLEPKPERDYVAAVAVAPNGIPGRFLSMGGSVSTPRLSQTHQSHDIRRPRLKKKRADSEAGGLQEAKLHASTPRSRSQREPLPMRMRALPQSFWQQPNRIQIPPATIYPVLPPLVTREGEDMNDFGAIALPDDCPEEERDFVKEKSARGTGVISSLSKTMPALSERRHHPERSMTVTNTDLLSKLFEVIDKDGKKPNQNLHIRKSRARKSTMATTSTGTNFLSGHDPYMIDSIAEKLFPQLSLENSKSYASYTGNTRLQLLTLKDGDRIVTLPSLTIDQNYPQMLSELVTHI